MKKMVLLVVCFFIIQVQASENDLSKVFQREYAFLIAQKESLIRDQGLLDLRHKETVKKLESEIMSLEKQVVKRAAANDALFEELQGLEKLKKEQQTRDNSLPNQLKKAHKALAEIEQSLKLEIAEKSGPTLPQQVGLLDFSEVKSRSLEALQQASKVSEFRGTYKNKEGELVEGPILRFGRIAAHAVQGLERKVLGPDGQGILTELEVVQADKSLLPFYLFESLLDKSIVKKKSGLWDSVADAIPLVVLGLMFLLVGGLFVVFAKE